MIETTTTLGEMMMALYEEYLTIYQDSDLAAVATAATVNELLAEAELGTEVSEAA